MTGSKVDGRLFVGREVELRRLGRAAQLDFNVLVLGERGIGLMTATGMSGYTDKCQPVILPGYKAGLLISNEPLRA